MKLGLVPGDFAFKALVKYNSYDSYKLTDDYFLSKKEAENFFSKVSDIKWPVEILDNGTLYVPAEEELK